MSYRKASPPPAAPSRPLMPTSGSAHLPAPSLQLPVGGKWGLVSGPAPLSSANRWPHGVASDEEKRGAGRRRASPSRGASAHIPNAVAANAPGAMSVEKKLLPWRRERLRWSCVVHEKDDRSEPASFCTAQCARRGVAAAAPRGSAALAVLIALSVN